MTRPALVAAGKAIRVDDQTQIAKYRRMFSTTQVWQTQAAYFDVTVPTIGFAHDYVRDAMSRVALFPAVQPEDPTLEPVPVSDETVPEGLDPDLPNQILDRLQPFPDFMGRVAEQLDGAGECHVALIASDDDVDREECRVL